MNSYIISREGSVYSMKLGGFLKPQLINSGYLRYQLNGKGKLAHRLVAEAYIPNPEGLKYVNHINGDKLDNRAGNLEWCTHSTNMLHAYRVLKIPHLSKLTEAQAKEALSLKGKVTAAVLAETYGISRNTILSLWSDRSWRKLPR